MSRLNNNPDIDYSHLHLTNISFFYSYNGIISIYDKRVDCNYRLNVCWNYGWEKEISGIMYHNNSIRIEAIGVKRIHHKGIISSLLEDTIRTSDRSIVLNKRKIGVLEESRGSRKDWGVKTLPLHHELKRWDTLYYDNTVKDVQIYHRGSLFALAKYDGNHYNMYILKDEFLPLCLALAIASIDSKDNYYAIRDGEIEDPSIQIETKVKRNGDETIRVTKKIL